MPGAAPQGLTDHTGGKTSRSRGWRGCGARGGVGRCELELGGVDDARKGIWPEGTAVTETQNHGLPGMFPEPPGGLVGRELRAGSWTCGRGLGPCPASRRTPQGCLIREVTWSAFCFGRTILPGMFAWEEVRTAWGTAATEVSQRSVGQSWGEGSGRLQNGRQVRARQDRGDGALDQEGTSVMQGFPGTLLTAAPGGWGVGGWPVVAYLPYRRGARGWDKCSHPSNPRRWRPLKPHKASALLPRLDVRLPGPQG